MPWGKGKKKAPSVLRERKKRRKKRLNVSPEGGKSEHR